MYVAGRASLVAGVGRVEDVCVWTSVAGSWCRSTSRLVCIELAYGRGNRPLNLTWALALRSRANERGNRQLKLTLALALCSRANGRGKPTAKASSGFSAAQPGKRTRERIECLRPDGLIVCFVVLPGRLPR